MVLVSRKIFKFDCFCFIMVIEIIDSFLSVILLVGFFVFAGYRFKRIRELRKRYKTRQRAFYFIE